MTARTIMIVDDSRISRMMTIAELESQSQDWTVLEAENASHALKLADGAKIDCFAIDFNMPGMDGLELIRKLRRDFPGSKYVLLTANVQDSIQTRAGVLGAHRIAKPVTVDSVGRMLEYFGA